MSPLFSSLAGRLARLVAVGVLAAAFVIALGFGYERVRLGTSDAETLRSIADEVRSTVAGITTGLRETAARAASDPALLSAAPSDPQAVRRLFDAVHAALPSAATGRGAITVYGSSPAPLAWSGRPSDLPLERIQGPRALFVAPGPSGPRLVFVEPIVERTTTERRVGSTTVERVLGGEDAVWTGRSDTAELPTSLVPVALRAPYEGAGESPPAYGFVVEGTDGAPLLEAEVAPSALRQLRTVMRNRTVDVALGILALTLIVLAVPIADARQRTRFASSFVLTTVTLILLVIAARWILAAAVPDTWMWATPASAEMGWRALVFRSPADLLFTALAAGALVAIAFTSVERRRLARRTRAIAPLHIGSLAAFVVVQASAGILLATLLAGHDRLIGRLLSFTSLTPLQFSLHPFDGRRLTFVVALLILHAAVLWGAVVVLRFASTWWRGHRQAVLRVLMATLWLAPVAVVGARWVSTDRASMVWPLLLAALVAIGLAALLRWAMPRYRHASQALRLMALFVVLALPSVVFYPTMIALAEAVTAHTIEGTMAPQALAHRSELQVQMRRALAQIDQLPDLAELVQGPLPPAGEAPPSDQAYLVWRQTELARRRLTSSVELYAASADLVSRFALNLPAEAAATQRWIETSCDWDVFGEPLAGTEDRVLLHAGRGMCTPGGGPPMGAIVVHVMLDYSTLPFLATESAYGHVESNGRQWDPHGSPIEFAMYGWGRTLIFASEGLGWPVTAELLDRIYRAGRQPLWEDVARDGQTYRVLFVNDRSAIYAIGYLLPHTVEHFTAAAEIVTLAGVAYLALLGLAAAVGAAGGHRASTARDLLREVRRSFYRKLFLAFVAAAIVPVLALALLTRTYVASELRYGIESEAARTASVARRVIENVASQQRRDSPSLPVLTDEVMLWVSRVISEDVNVFVGPRLIATSQRDLFASGRLPTRTPAEVYRAIVLDRRAGYVGEERIGDLAPYTVAATPVRDGDVRTMLTVPLAPRQQEIEREIDSLDRRMLLATVCFILVAAALGYYMAERIADPVNRLTRATRRIARGDLDARIVTSSADEFRRLVDAFNSMAGDLLRQRTELERTNRLAAWAEMARQVAHDIKNPLTPIQLSAEHLRRVHDDRSRPLSPVLESCVDTILSQVRLLRQISSEFSSFASAPVAKPAPVSLNDVVEEVLKPYRTSLARTIELETHLSPDVPVLQLDRMLIGRALVNIVENALHAMPGGGVLTVQTDVTDGHARLCVVDTGVGMDDASRARLFEPYFSTRAAGTGLGLTIAKRNVELNGGIIAVDSAPSRGTTVRLMFPLDYADEAIRR